MTVDNTSNDAIKYDMAQKAYRLPLIPLSSLVQQSIECAKALEQTSLLLADGGGHGSLLEKEREKLDKLTKNIQNIHSCFLDDFSLYDIAKEIAYIDCSLFRLVVLDNQWVCDFDKQSNVVPLLDFHRYLSHAFAHQVIYCFIQENQLEERHVALDGKKRPSGTSNIIGGLIQVAYMLLHIYRDFSGCTAILTCLEMPEIQRLSKLWQQCPSNLISIYKDLICMLSPTQQYESYQHLLWLHTEKFSHAQPLQSRVIAIPFIQAHLSILKSLICTHSQSETTSYAHLLSDPAKNLRMQIIQLLKFCQQQYRIDRNLFEKVTHPITDLDNSNLSSSVKPSVSKRGSINDSRVLKFPVESCLDLEHKLHSNQNVYHWIVSRVYLSRAQLYCESLQAEPLSKGELRTLPVAEETDLYWDFFAENSNNEYQNLSKRKDNSSKNKLSCVAKEVEDADEAKVPMSTIMKSIEKGDDVDQNLNNIAVTVIEDTVTKSIAKDVVQFAVIPENHKNAETSQQNKQEVGKERDEALTLEGLSNSTKKDTIDVDDKMIGKNKSSTDLLEENYEHMTREPNFNNLHEIDLVDDLVLSITKERTVLKDNCSEDSQPMVWDQSINETVKEYLQSGDNIQNEQSQIKSHDSDITVGETRAENFEQPVHSEETAVLSDTINDITSLDSENVQGNKLLENKPSVTSSNSKEENSNSPGLPYMPSLSNTNPAPTSQTPHHYQSSTTEDDLIILNTAQEEDEEWTGYPMEISQTAIKEEYEEEWTGYPLKEGEDDSEVWEGYPVPEDSPILLSPNIRDVTSKEDQNGVNESDSDDEEWKCYRKALEAQESLSMSNSSNKVEHKELAENSLEIQTLLSSDDQPYEVDKAHVETVQRSLSSTGGSS